MKKQRRRPAATGERAKAASRQTAGCFDVFASLSGVLLGKGPLPSSRHGVSASTVPRGGQQSSKRSRTERRKRLFFFFLLFCQHDE